MALQIFGPAAVVSVLNRAFTNTSPSNAVFNNQLTQAGTTPASQYAFAESFGATFAVGKTAAELSKLVMDNMGLDNQLLADALTDYITVHGTNKIGIIAYQLGTLLSPLENDATYGAAAKAWNAEVTASYEYSADPSNTVPSTGDVNGNEAGKNFVLTVGQDVRTGTSGADFFRGVAGVQVGNQDQTTLNSSDILDGGFGQDALIVNLTGPLYQGGARIKNIETLQLGTNGTAAFDYNINAGQNEITGVTTIVADQINATESLTLRNIVRDAADTDLPTISWVNDSTAINGMAGTVNVNYRAASVSGTADEQAVSLTNVRAGALNIAGGVETIKLTSAGTATNSVNAIDSITGVTSTLEKVFITADAQLGGARKISTTAGTIGMEVDQAPANGNTEHVSNVAMGARVTLVDATGSTAGVNVAFTDGATAVNNTFIGGEGNDTAVFLGGNDKFEGGKGDDTVVFRQTNTSSNGTFFNNSDSVDGGEGKDTILVDYAKDSGANNVHVNGVTLQTSEWLNSKGVDVLDIRSTNARVQLDDSFVGRADAGSFEVVTNKIVQNDSTTSVADEMNSRTQIDLTTVGANRAVKVTGGEGRETVIVTDALNGVQTISGGNGFDVLVVQNGATLTGQDLANVSGINTFNLVKTGAAPQTFNVDLTAAFLTAAIDPNAGAGVSKNVQNAFRVVTDVNDARGNVALNGVQLIGTGDVVNVTIDTTGLTTAGAVNLNDLLATAAAVNVTNATGTALLTKVAGVGGAITVNGAVAGNIFNGAVAAENAAYGDMTANSVAGVGTPLASGANSVGGGGGAGAAGNTFTLTAGTDIITTTSSTLVLAPTTYFGSGNDVVTSDAGRTDNGDILVDGSTTDADVLNATLTAAYTPANITNIETLNYTLLADSAMNMAGATGYNTIGLTGSGTRAATITNLLEGKTINANSSNMTISMSTLAASTTNAATVNLNGVTGVTLSNGVNDIDVLTLAGGTNTNSITIGSDFSAAADQITVTGTGALTVNATEAIATGIKIAGTTPTTFTLGVDDSANNNGIALVLTNVTGLDAMTISDGAASGTFATTNQATGVTTTFASEMGALTIDGTNALTDTATFVTGGTSTTDRVGNITTTDMATVTLNLGTHTAATDTEALTIDMGNVAGTQSLIFGASNAAVTLTVTNADVINASALTNAAATTAFTIGTNNSASAMSITGSATNINSIVGSAQADIIVGGALNDTITGAGGVDAITLGTGSDTVMIGANLIGATAAAADSVTGFTFGATASGGDIISLSVTQNGAVAAVDRITNGGDNAVAAGAAVVQVVSGAATVAAATNVIALSGTFADEATMVTAINTGGSRALTVQTADPTNNVDYAILWSNGTNSFLTIVNDPDAAGTAAVLGATAVATVVTLVGVTDVSTALAANFVFTA